MPSQPQQNAQSQPEWYADGLRFHCTQCGNCCTGPPGYVWLTDEESAAMADELQLSLAEFEKTYTRRVNGDRSLNERKTKLGYDCIFLDRESQPGKAVCSLYNARPAQCKTWPFWPENLVSKRRWQGVKRSTPCPGMDRGQLVPIESIRIQRDTTTK